MTLEHYSDAYNRYLLDEGIYSRHPKLKGGVIALLRQREYEKNMIIPYVKIVYSFIFAKAGKQYKLASLHESIPAAELTPNKELTLELSILNSFIRAIENNNGIVNLILRKMIEYDTNK